MTEDQYWEAQWYIGRYSYFSALGELYPYEENLLDFLLGLKR